MYCDSEKCSHHINAKNNRYTCFRFLCKMDAALEKVYNKIQRMDIWMSYTDVNNLLNGDARNAASMLQRLRDHRHINNEEVVKLKGLRKQWRWRLAQRARRERQRRQIAELEEAIEKATIRSFAMSLEEHVERKRWENLRSDIEDLLCSLALRDDYEVILINDKLALKRIRAQLPDPSNGQGSA